MKKILFGVAALGLLGLAGAGLGLKAQDVVETKATASTSFAVGSVLYIDDSASNWDDSGYKIGIWNHQGNVVNVATYDDASGYYKITITGAACTSFNLIRHSSLTEGAGSFPTVTNQSDNISVSAGCNLLVGGDYVDGKMTMESWSSYSNGVLPSGDVQTGSIYLRVPNSKCNYYVYTYEAAEVTVDGFNANVTLNLMGAWDSCTQLEVSEKDVVFNPANLDGRSSYGVLKATFNYYDINNVGVIVRAIQFTDGEYEFQTKNLIVGASADNEMELSLGAYYYGTDDWNLWKDMSFNVAMGPAAATAYELGKNICDLSKSTADTLREGMETNAAYLTDATWDGYTYDQVYDFVDEQCTTPKNSAKSIAHYDEAENNSLGTVAIAIIAATLLGAGAFFIARKRRAE